MFAMFLYLTLYIQNALGQSPQEAGLRFLPSPLPAASSVHLAVGLPVREGFGLTTLHPGNLRGLGPASTPVARHPRRAS